LSTEKQRDTSRGHEDTYSPFNTSKKLEVEFLSTKDMNRGVWPPFRNKENEVIIIEIFEAILTFFKGEYPSPNII